MIDSPPDEPDDEKTVYIPSTTSHGPAGVPPAPPSPPPDAAVEPTIYAPAASSLPPSLPAGVPQPPVASDEVQPITAGDVLNGIYQVHRFIARGGMGEVFEGFNVHHPEERVAVKIMLPHLARDESVAAMFAKEASMLTKLQHEYLVQYRLAARDIQGRPFIVTEFVDGPSLEDQLGKDKPDEKQLAGLFRRLAEGLGAAHQIGAIHRDIAPDNILLAGGKLERPKIIDFGIAKDLDRNRGTIVGDGFAGKLKYVAPEQLGAFDREVGAWSDIYSLALVMLAVASGKHADMGGSIADAVMKRNAVPDLASIPERLRPVFAAALAPDPANRPRNMAELIQLIDRAMGGKRGAARTVDSTPAVPKLARGKTKTDSKPKDGAAAKADALAKVEDKKPPGKLFQGLKARQEGGPNWLLIGGGGVAVLLLFVAAMVVLSGGLGGGKDAQVASGTTKKSAAPEAKAPSVSVEAVATAAAQQATCSWLTLVGTDGNLLRFSGGSGNSVTAQNEIASALEADGIKGTSFDSTKVLGFPPKVCAALDAFRNIRSEQPLIESPRTDYEMEMRIVIGGNGQPELAALPIIRVSNIQADENLALLSVGSDGEIYKLAEGRDEIERLVKKNQDGVVKPDGFNVTLPLTEKGNFGFIVVAGKGRFPDGLRAKAGSSLNIGSDWQRQFGLATKDGSWRADIMWFQSTDNLPNEKK